MEELEMKRLWQIAAAAREKAYCPYSRFAVGAALLCADGTVVTGCNVENAAYGPSICAERTAVVKAVSEGKKEFLAIAVAGGAKDAEPALCYPCGVCRQVLREFAVPGDFLVICGRCADALEVSTLSQLLPKSFSL